MQKFKASSYCSLLAVIWLMLCSSVLYAQTDLDKDLSMMGTLSDWDLHDLQHEAWNAYAQATYISSWKNGFSARYSNLNGTPNSLSTQAAQSFTATFTAHLGAKAWQGAEFYLAPEMISELPLSGLKGLGGSLQNFELQKNGSVSATWYRARAFYRQAINLGGMDSPVASGPLQLAGNVNSRRFVFTAGNLSVIDIFDQNSYASNLRQQFFNMAFLTHAAYDFAADARGYSWGVVGELFYDDWALRFGRFITPKNPNDLPLDFRFFSFYGDQVELVHKHSILQQPGAVRLLAYRNRENAGRWNDAIAAFQANSSQNATTCSGFNYGSENATAPDLCWARKPNIKMGIGINLEQALTDDIGIFFRGMYSDGNSEVYSYTSSDRSVSFGVSLTGLRWGRPKDGVGVGYAQSWISQQHAKYLNMGGIDGFIGDGKISLQPESVVDIYYRLHVLPSFWVSADYQHISNPAYNADRGPVDILVPGYILNFRSSFCHSVYMKIILVLVNVLLGISSLALHAAALADADKTLAITEQQAIAMFYQRNLDLIAANFNIDNAQAQQIIAAAIPNPVFSFNISSLSPAIFNDQNSNQPLPAVSPQLQQLIETAGKRRLRIESSELATEAVNFDVKDTLRTLTNAVRRAYYGLVLTQKNVQMAEDNIKRYQDIVRVNSIRLKAGDISATDFTRIEVESIKAQADLDQAQAALKQARAALLLLLGWPEQSMHLVAVETWPQPNPKLVEAKQESLVQQAIELRPDLQAAKVRIEQAEKMLTLAQRLAIPDVTVSAYYQRDPGNYFTNSVGVGISVPLPLFYRQEGEIAQARFGVSSADIALRQIEQNVRADVMKALASWQSADAIAKRFEDQVLQRVENLRHEQEYAYQNGAIGLLDLLDAERGYKAVMLEYYTALANRSNAWADLLMAYGEEVKL